MPKSSFKAVNRQFGAFLRTELKNQGMTFSMLRKRCHFNNNALSDIKNAGSSDYPIGYYQQVLLAFREFVDDAEFEEIRRRWAEALSHFEVIEPDVSAD